MEREHSTNVNAAQQEISQHITSFILLSAINVLNQPRQTFEEIDSLATSIARKGTIHDINVAEYNQEGAQNYIDTINSIWGTQHSIDELVTVPNKDSKENHYYILIAGERRLRAYKLLASDGCLDCQEKYGKDPCLNSKRHPHFTDDGTIEVKLINQPPPVEAIDIQASENTHMRPPPEEEAVFYDRYFKIKKDIDPSYTIAHFARDVGKSPSAIRDALRFCTLPQDVQTDVRNGDISYGIGVQLQRLKNALELDAEEFNYWVMIAKADKVHVSDFTKRVSEVIESKQTNQTLLGIFDEAQEKEMRKMHIKLVVAKHTVLGLWSFIHYFKRIQKMLESGELGRKESPYSIKSPLRVYKTLITQERELIPHLKDLLDTSEIEEAQKVLKLSEEIILSLEQTTLDETQIFPQIPN